MEQIPLPERVVRKVKIAIKSELTNQDCELSDTAGMTAVQFDGYLQLAGVTAEIRDHPDFFLSPQIWNQPLNLKVSTYRVRAGTFRPCQLHLYFPYSVYPYCDVCSVRSRKEVQAHGYHTDRTMQLRFPEINARGNSQNYTLLYHTPWHVHVSISRHTDTPTRLTPYFM